MIPNRLLLRAATVLALTRGGEGPFPTMAGEAVFDTKLLPVTDMAQETHLPVILVYTDGDRKRNREKNTTRTWERKIELVIEIAISSLGPNKAEWAETDAELEATLDLFEAEVEQALMDPTNPWAVHWKKLLKSIDAWDSEPHRSAEQTVRLAARQIVLEVCLASDCYPTPITGTPEVTPTQDADGDFIPGSLLPIPYLLPFEQTLLGSEIFKSTCAMLTGASSQPIVPALKRIGIKVDAIDPADPNRFADGQTRGPDGRIEIEAQIEDLDK